MMMMIMMMILTAMISHDGDDDCLDHVISDDDADDYDDGNNLHPSSPCLLVSLGDKAVWGCCCVSVSGTCGARKGAAGPAPSLYCPHRVCHDVTLSRLR